MHMLPGPIGFLVILGVFAVVVALINRVRGGSASRDPNHSAGDMKSTADGSFGPSGAESSSADNHHHSTSEGAGDRNDSDTESSDGGWDSDGSSSDSTDTGGSDGASSVD